jgi:hypothetical protein
MASTSIENDSFGTDRRETSIARTFSQWIQFLSVGFSEDSQNSKPFRACGLHNGEQFRENVMSHGGMIDVG